ncbi:MAG: ATPase, partial [Acidimicrobiales bacterium]|nr:ATPase [Acidimicrobiales bacterium]
GKTLAAEIISGELGLDLYKVDIAGLVSKFIGETEKNLSQVFDAAEAANVVLFFDEADGIIGKRSEVADSHDRYANLEVSYLLQRMERFDGVVVLATNFPKNIDAAFNRRIHVSVEFPMPEAAERERIWHQSIPSTAPIADIDLADLGRRFELSGGSIRNAALTAAFLAAEHGSVITNETLRTAVQREFQKQGRLFHDTDLS